MTSIDHPKELPALHSEGSPAGVAEDGVVDAFLRLGWVAVAGAVLLPFLIIACTGLMWGVKAPVAFWLPLLFLAALGVAGVRGLGRALD